MIVHAFKDMIYLFNLSDPKCILKVCGGGIIVLIGYARFKSAPTLWPNHVCDRHRDHQTTDGHIATAVAPSPYFERIVHSGGSKRSDVVAQISC